MSARLQLHRLAAAAALVALLTGCASTGNSHGEAQAAARAATAASAIPAQLPAGAGGVAETPAIDWRSLAPDAALAALVEQALAHNLDLRVAALNVERAQALLAGSEANRAPVIGAGVNAQRAPNSQGNQANSYSAGVQLASWELDLFGRLKAQDEAARAQWLASAAGQRAAELSLASQVMATVLALRADDALLAVTQRTLASREQTLQLVALRERVGAASALELQAQQSLVAQARATLAQATRARAQDAATLALLVGRPVADGAWALPGLAAEAQAGTAALGELAQVPVGLSSQVLLARPDVVQAEQGLVAARANLAAARAALWPSVTLTAQAGQAAGTLSGLFEGGNFAYTVAANVLLTVFDGGRRESAINAAGSAERIAVAQYQRAAQVAFRETADALAGLATWRAQREAVAQQRDLARDTDRLTTLRLQQGAASALEQQDAQRNLLAAEQALLQVRLAELNNRVALFKALGR
ncbi:MAG: efflux transporter outer membrane subunit [Burkholderiaceae bacterium]|nr:efflux transporter outer membrane subunit [Burkholderiaceae bacterium]